MQTRMVGEKIMSLQKQNKAANAHMLASALTGIPTQHINGDALFASIRVQCKIFLCVMCKNWLSLIHEEKAHDEVCHNCAMRRPTIGGEG